MIGDFGEVTVLDWGLAKQLTVEQPEDDLDTMVTFADASASATLQGEQLGTPAYMAPEQATGRIEFPVDISLSPVEGNSGLLVCCALRLRRP